MAAAHPSHTLVLMWPYSNAVEGVEEVSASGVNDDTSGVNGSPSGLPLPWDARALEAYRGEIVAHVGEVSSVLGAQSRTTSRALPYLTLPYLTLTLPYLTLPSQVHSPARHPAPFSTASNVILSWRRRSSCPSGRITRTS